MKEDCPPSQNTNETPTASHWYLFVILVLGVVIIIGLLAAYPIKGSSLIPDDSVTVVLQDVSKGSVESREQAALEMLRLGADRWMLECAYEQGKHGVSREAMLRSCAVDWELSPLD